MGSGSSLVPAWAYTPEHYYTWLLHFFSFRCEWWAWVQHRHADSLDLFSLNALTNVKSQEDEESWTRGFEQGVEIRMLITSNGKHKTRRSGPNNIKLSSDGTKGSDTAISLVNILQMSFPHKPNTTNTKFLSHYKHSQFH
ncbi:hypothetical protein RJT34_26644 [Clitoria ternatea]|uniref:Uncharacterized protein n=1 Tax=Clitoria ternatea TaxID=43366 RepID=A0AAN9FFS5_CLITE